MGGSSGAFITGSPTHDHGGVRGQGKFPRVEQLSVGTEQLGCLWQGWGPASQLPQHRLVCESRSLISCASPKQYSSPCLFCYGPQPSLIQCHCLGYYSLIGSVDRSPCSCRFPPGVRGSSIFFLNESWREPCRGFLGMRVGCAKARESIPIRSLHCEVISSCYQATVVLIRGNVVT